MSDGKKYDAGKAPFVRGCLHYFPRALNAVADVSDYGGKKYEVPLEDQNFARVADGTHRYTDALGRHLAAEGYELLDPESGLRHAAHAAWNALARLEMMIREELEQPVREEKPAEVTSIPVREPRNNGHQEPNTGFGDAFWIKDR